MPLTPYLLTAYHKSIIHTKSVFLRTFRCPDSSDKVRDLLFPLPLTAAMYYNKYIKNFIFAAVPKSFKL